MANIHVIVTTHTTRHLRRTLMGVVCQQNRPRSVTVTVDGDDPAIGALVEAAAVEFGMDIRLVTRAHTGACRSAQVRNNGARAAIDAAGGIGAMGDDALVFFDGDCCPAPENLAAYERLLSMPGRRPVDLVLGHWITLTPEQTEAFDEAAIKAGRWPAHPTAAELAKLPARRRRYWRQVFFRRIGLGKSHKPKLASGNFAIRTAMFAKVNGFDEMYEGYGQEDDDLGRRVYRAGGRVEIGVDTALVFHQWHPTRQPGAWETAPGVERFRKPFTARCEWGMLHPREQPALFVRLFSGSPATVGAVGATR